MNAVFVDTSAWYAASKPSDPDHRAAKQWFAKNRKPLVVTDYIVDELLTLFTYRKERKRAIELGGELLSGKAATVEWVTPKDFKESWKTFVDYQDKNWSFTDCVSLVVMKRLRIGHALAFDQHFRQFETVTVLP